MPEQITAPKRSAPEIIKDIQIQLKRSSGKRPSPQIFSDILTVDHLAQAVNKQGVLGFPSIKEYMSSIGQIAEVKQYVDQKLNSDKPAERESAKRLREILGLNVNEKKAHQTKGLTLSQKMLLGFAALSSVLNLPGPIHPHIPESPAPKVATANNDRPLLAMTTAHEEPPQQTVQESSPKKEVFSKNETLGFRITSPEDIRALPPNVGIIRIGGDSNLMSPDGRFHHNPDHLYEEMLKLADEKGLKVVFAYKNSDPETSEDVIKAHLKTISKHPSVKYIEIGNEIDDSQFWKGSMGDYAGLFKKADSSFKSLKAEGLASQAELVITSFADPMGYENKGKSEEYFMDLALSLKARGINTRDYLVAGHAYHLDTLEWVLNKLQTKLNTKGIIITEFGSDDPKEFEQMAKLLHQKKMIGLVHEFNPFNPRTYNRYSIKPDDQRFNSVMTLLKE